VLEIIVLIILCKKMAEKARSKGRAAAGYVLLLILFWLCGEFFGAMVGAAATRGQGEFLVLVVFALGGAAIGAGIAFAILNSLPAIQAEQDDSERFGRDLDARYPERFNPTPRRQQEPSADYFPAREGYSAPPARSRQGDD
jgi:hypothetical protein